MTTVPKNADIEQKTPMDHIPVMAGAWVGFTLSVFSNSSAPAFPNNNTTNKRIILRIMFLEVVSRHFLNLMEKVNKRIARKRCCFY